MGCGDGQDNRPLRVGDLGYDPADNARRYVAEMHRPCTLRECTLMKKAARATLIPIQERYQEFLSGHGDARLFHEDLEKLIYTTEQLMGPWR